jgi:hypothetical protein
MCSIFGTFDVVEAKRLQQLNSRRGVISNSSTVFDNNINIVSMTKQYGELDDFKEELSGYHLYHQQAPTSQENDTIHPSEYKNSFLWHNGIVKQDTIKKLMSRTGNNSLWDTHQINVLLNTSFTNDLDLIEGSFSCIWYKNNNLYMFRNQISPMFFNGSTISSEKFENSIETIPNTMYIFENSVWVEKHKFINNELPFFFFD